MYIKKHGPEKYTESILKLMEKGYRYPKEFKEIDDVDKILKIFEVISID